MSIFRTQYLDLKVGLPRNCRRKSEDKIREAQHHARPYRNISQTPRCLEFRVVGFL